MRAQLVLLALVAAANAAAVDKRELLRRFASSGAAVRRSARSATDVNAIPYSGCGVCHANGNTYRALAGCRTFTEESDITPPRKLECPAGLVFDTTLCVCNYENAVKCAAECTSVPQPPELPPVRPAVEITKCPALVPTGADDKMKVTIGCGQCEAGGSVYRTIAGSGCMAFSEEAPGMEPKRFVCPDGLVFDTNLCVCNWREAVQCSHSCGGSVPPATAGPTVPVPTVPTTGRPPVNNDVFIPKSGCGACHANGNTYRALAGCRSFTEESSITPARKLDCPAGLVFDTTLCVCNYENAVQCSSDCGSAPVPPTIPPDVVRPPTQIIQRPPIVPTGDVKVTVGCGQCVAGGNVYRPLAGSSCAAFTEEAPGIAPKRLVCPEGLVFDTNLCVCNWREAVTCSGICSGGEPPVSGVTVPAPKPTTGRPPVKNDLFIPQSGCGVCTSNGNTYRALPGCRSFTEESPITPARKMDCPAGLIFDTTLCVCNYECSVKCASDCSSVPVPPTQPPVVVKPPAVIIIERPPVVPTENNKVTVGCGQCMANGNVYRTLAGSDCMAFTEEAPGIAPRRLVCPDGLIFDTNLCVCNWREAVTCSSTCGSQPPATGVTVHVPQPPTGRPPINNDLFIPQSGCGVCKANGNTYRALAGCRSFTEESDTTPARRLDCPAGLVFDTTLCVCNYQDAVKCSSDCSGVQVPPTLPPDVVRPPTVIINRPPVIPTGDESSKVTVGCGQCTAGGNIYRTIAGSNCTAFTEETPDIGPRRLVCPAGLVFDTNLCVCNWREAVTCSSTCGGSQPPSPVVTGRPAQTPTGRPIVNNDLFIPQSGCGVCHANGNTYRALTGCRSFTEESATTPARKLDCPAGLVFDTTLCVCNYECSVKCASDCGSVPVPPTQPPVVVKPPTVLVEKPPVIPTVENQVTVGCGQCMANGNVYRTMIGTGCMAFTEEAPGIAPKRLVCPDGLVFDTNLCVCNWREAVKCSSTCGSQPPIPPVVIVQTTPAPTGRPPVKNDIFVPQTGCGVCFANGNTYRALAGCRSFTEESDVIPPRKIDCPAGLVFDTTLCVCNYQDAVKCASDCGKVPEPPKLPADVFRPPSVVGGCPPIVPNADKHVTVGCGQCRAGGNIYNTIAGSGCMAFTEEAPGIAPRRLVCPEGLVFDTNLCVCNWRDAVTCSSTCGVPEVTAVPPLPATGRPPVFNDVFIPQSGCGVCKANGNTYRALTGCRSFTEESDVIPPRKLDCPAGLVFDTTLCVCNYEDAVKCAADCGSVPTPPILPPDVVRPPAIIINRPPVIPINDNKVTVGCGQCEAGGNVYRTMIGSGCMAFTEEAPGIAPKRLACPEGLVFDTNLCVCNWREAVTCSATCGGNTQPPSTAVTVATPKPATGRPPVNNDLFIPKSGCGVCQANGNIYRALAGCRSFTEESDVIPPRKLDCPAGLVFDTTLCVCNYEDAVKCASDCGSVPVPPTQPPAVLRPPTPVNNCPPVVPSIEGLIKVTVGCGQCQSGGNVYRTIANSDCMAFTEEAPEIAPRRLICPDGLVFDTNLCVCNWREAVQCSSTCGGQPPVTTQTARPTQPPTAAPTQPPTAAPTQPPTARPTVSKDLFIPQSGCGVCHANGNTYRALAGCHAFTEESDVIPPRKLHCPAGLVFDTTLCVCNYEDAVKCASDCGGVPVPPTQPPIIVRPPTNVIVDRPPVIPSHDSKVIVGCGQCQAGGNIYRPISGSDCKAFTEEAPGVGARSLVCPDGLVFDTNLCVCNWREAVQCSSTCDGGRPPATVPAVDTPRPPTQPAPQPTTSRPPAIPEIFVPESGCGMCKANGNIYRALFGCASFTEESATTPPRQIDCPAGLLFDTTLCVCNYDYAVKCASTCDPKRPQIQQQTQPPELPTARPPAIITARPPVVPCADGSSKVEVGCGACQAGGNIYRTISGSSCTAFTEEAPGFAPKSLVCPNGLVFDTNLCVCNWRDAVQCSSTCNGQVQPTVAVTARPTVAITAAPQPKVEQWKAPSGHCGVCVASGITFRTVPGTGCAGFTKETATMAPTRFDCQPGLIFDPSICQCNYKGDFACTCSASDKP